jgi:hypothetical protein
MWYLPIILEEDGFGYPVLGSTAGIGSKIWAVEK